MDISPYATNQHNVRVQPLDYTNEQTPSMMVYHGLSIVVNGSVVGRIESYQASNPYNRKVTAVYELSAYTWGQPVDNVPGGSEGEYTMEITRGEVWGQEFELACGFPAVWENLTDQTRPFSLMEFWMRGTDLYRIWMYTGCWFQQKNYGGAFEAAGDGIVKVSGTIAYVKRSIVS